MTLKTFVTDWLRDTPLRPPANAYDAVAGYVGLTLFRDAPFQVQLWSFPPNTEVPPHSHPDLDTWLVRVTGKFRMTRNGEDVTPADAERVTWRGMRTWMTRVAPGDVHSVSIGASGGSFLSITERLDGSPPESVHLVWGGAALDEAHAATLGGTT